MPLIRWVDIHTVHAVSCHCKQLQQLCFLQQSLQLLCSSHPPLSVPLFGLRAHTIPSSSQMRLHHMLAGYCQPRSGGKAAAAAVECHQEDAAVGRAEEAARSQTQAQEAW